jgi:hypothetical protein
MICDHSITVVKWDHSKFLDVHKVQLRQLFAEAKQVEDDIVQVCDCEVQHTTINDLDDVLLLEELTFLGFGL